MSLTTTEEQIELLIKQMYGNERLTDALTDETAELLLSWGEQELQNMANLTQNRVDDASQQLRRAIRSINNLVGQHLELSEMQVMQRLLTIVKLAMRLTEQKYITKQESNLDDQETENKQKKEEG